MKAALYNGSHSIEVGVRAPRRAGTRSPAERLIEAARRQHVVGGVQSASRAHRPS
jgi:hypothetical protein